MNRNDIGHRFEGFVAEIFEAEGFSVKKQVSVGGHLRADLLVTAPNGKSAVVEVKFLRTKTLLPSTLLLIANQLELTRRSAQASYGIIAIAGEAPPAKTQLLAEFPNVLVYDASALSFLASKNPALLEQFEALIRETAPFSNLSEPEPKEVNPVNDFKQGSLSADLALPKPEQRKGTDLCTEIRAIKSGQNTAKQFEEKLIEALKYIFEKDLTAWAKQKSTDTGISVYDVVARVASEHDFWTARRLTFFVVDELRRKDVGKGLSY
jgi:hypothetical protein